MKKQRRGEREGEKVQIERRTSPNRRRSTVELKHSQNSSSKAPYPDKANKRRHQEQAESELLTYLLRSDRCFIIVPSLLFVATKALLFQKETVGQIVRQKRLLLLPSRAALSNKASSTGSTRLSTGRTNVRYVWCQSQTDDTKTGRRSPRASKHLTVVADVLHPLQPKERQPCSRASIREL